MSGETARRSDTLWLRLAAIEDPEFGFGVPAGISRDAFSRLALFGFVVIREIGEGRRAVITDKGHVELERRRARARRFRAIHSEAVE